MPEPTLTWKLVDDIAAELGVPETTRLKWRQPKRGVPLARQIEIVEYLKHRDMTVAFADFDKLPENPGRIAA